MQKGGFIHKVKIQRGQIVELDIDRMAYGGQGVGRADGFVVFVRGVALEDRIRARIYKKKRSWGEAELVEVITPSPDRIRPLCPHSGFCGGCQWQHVVYKRQLEYKTDQVKEALLRIGGLSDPLVKPTQPSPEIFAYRNKMEFSFSDRRWSPPGEIDGFRKKSDFALGLHVPGTFSKVLDIEACLLQHEKGNQILREVKEFARGSGMPAYSQKTHQGFWRFLALRRSHSLGEWMVNVVSSEERNDILKPMTDLLCRKVHGIQTVVNSITRRKASVASGERQLLLTGKGYIQDSLGSFIFRVSANSFFQPNSPAAKNLFSKVVELAELKGTETLLDLYSGTGAISIFLSKYARRVIGIEFNLGAVLDARQNCRETGVDNCRFICGDVRKELPLLRVKPQVVIIDPPRAGLHKDVLARVLALGPERIVYVSCNPTTLSRDLVQMVRDYELLEIQPFDLFPHTYHVECVARLRTRKNLGA